MGKPERAPVGPVTNLRDAGDGGGGEMTEQVLRVQRPSETEPQSQAVAGRCEGDGTAAAQVGWSECEHGTDGVVELSDAREPGGDRDLGHRQRGRLDQDARGLGALGASQRERARAQFGGKQPLELAFAIAEPSCEAGTPARSMTPSAMSRIARATTSARVFHSGEPGAASGRHRLQALKPAR